MTNANNNNFNLVSPGLRLYVEDPQTVIKRQIKRSFLIIIIALVITAGILVYAVSKVKTATSGLSEKQNQLAGLINNNAAGMISADEKNNWEQIASYTDKIKAALPESTDLLSYQSALEQAAQAAGVQISVNFAATAGGAKPQNIPSGGQKTTITNSVEHSVDVRGNLANFDVFLKNLENIPYYVQVESFNLTSQQGVDKDAQATVTLKVYTQ